MMLHLFMGNDPWFRAKRYGIGAGFPIRWQGWTLLASYVGIIAGIVRLFQQPNALLVSLGIILFLGTTAIFLAIVHNRTVGGWKWRGGE